MTFLDISAILFMKEEPDQGRSCIFLGSCEQEGRYEDV